MRSSATTQDAPKTSIRVSPHSATIYVGQLQSMGAATLDDAGDSTGVATVSWSSSAAAVASVAEDGIVTGLTPGVTTVVAATGAGSRDSSKITVIDQPCAGFARAPNLRGTATFVYAYTATLGEIEYAAHEGATMNFTATSQGFVVNNLVTWLGSATGSGVSTKAAPIIPATPSRRSLAAIHCSSPTSTSRTSSSASISRRARTHSKGTRTSM